MAVTLVGALGSGCDEPADVHDGEPLDSSCDGAKCDEAGTAAPLACYTRQDTRWSDKVRCVRAIGSFEPGAPLQIQVTEREAVEGLSYDCVDAFEDPFVSDFDWDLVLDASAGFQRIQHDGTTYELWKYAPNGDASFDEYVNDTVDGQIDWALVERATYRGSDGRSRDGVRVRFDDGRFNSPISVAFTPIWWPLFAERSLAESSFCTEYQPREPDVHPFGSLRCLDFEFDGGSGGLGACAKTVTGYTDGQKVSNCYKYCLDDAGRPREGMAALNRQRGMPEATTNIECLEEPLTWCLDQLRGGRSCLRSNDYAGAELWRPFCRAQ